MVDRRIVPDLRWIAAALPDLHHRRLLRAAARRRARRLHRLPRRALRPLNGLAVDIVPLNGDGNCDATWRGITRLAHWAEPARTSRGRPSAGSATTATPATAAATTSTSPGSTRPAPPNPSSPNGSKSSRPRPPAPASRASRGPPHRPEAAHAASGGISHRPLRRPLTARRLRLPRAHGSVRSHATVMRAADVALRRMRADALDRHRVRYRRSSLRSRLGRLRRDRRLDPGRLPRRREGLPAGARRDAPERGRASSGETPDQRLPDREPGGGELATVGAAMVRAATELNAEARADPGGAGQPAARLPARRGRARRRATPTGIHAELIRRLDVRRPLQPRQPAAAARLRARLPAKASTPARRAAEAPAAQPTEYAAEWTKSMEATTLTEQLWGGETTKAVENFPVSGERVPVPVVRWLGRLKAAAARVNGELGGLDPALAERIADGRRRGRRRRARRPVPDRRLPDRLRHLLEHERQRGDRQPRRRRGPPQRPRQHGPVLQRRLPLGGPPGGARRGHPRPAAGDGRARGRARGQGGAVRRRRQGRPHPPDGRGPGHPRPGVRRLRGAGPARRRSGSRRRCAGSARSRSAAPRPAPASTPTPSSPPRCASGSPPRPGWRSPAPLDPFEAQGNRDALVELSGALKVYAVSLNKIANDLALMGSGPARRPRRAAPARAAEGLLDHAGEQARN